MELAKPIGLRPLKPPYRMVNFIELHLAAQVEKIWHSPNGGIFVSLRQAKYTKIEIYTVKMFNLTLSSSLYYIIIKNLVVIGNIQGEVKCPDSLNKPELWRE